MLYCHSYFKFPLQYTIGKIQEEEEKLKLNGTHHFVVYADDVNVQGENINVINKNTGGVLEVGSEVHATVKLEKNKNEFMSRHRAAGQNYNIRKRGNAKIGGNDSNKSILHS
jgi:hypothetical protein